MQPQNSVLLHGLCHRDILCRCTYKSFIAFVLMTQASPFVCKSRHSYPQWCLHSSKNFVLFFPSYDVFYVSSTCSDGSTLAKFCPVFPSYVFYVSSGCSYVSTLARILSCFFPVMMCFMCLLHALLLSSIEPAGLQLCMCLHISSYLKQEHKNCSVLSSNCRDNKNQMRPVGLMIFVGM
jgi:hypothetical protein